MFSWIVRFSWAGRFSKLVSCHHLDPNEVQRERGEGDQREKKETRGRDQRERLPNAGI
jgi:hypothetical protein